MVIAVSKSHLLTLNFIFFTKGVIGISLQFISLGWLVCDNGNDICGRGHLGGENDCFNNGCRSIGNIGGEND